MVKRTLKYSRKRRGYRKTYRRRMGYKKRRAFRKKNDSEQGSILRRIHMVRQIQYRTDVADSSAYAIIPFGCAYDNTDVNSFSFTETVEFTGFLALYRYYKLVGVKAEIFPLR